MLEKTNICCPKFNPEKWDKKTFVWDKKPFIKETLHTFFHIPFPPTIDKKITKMCQTLEDSKTAEPNKDDTLILFRDPTAFSSEIYMSVTGPVPTAHNATVSGTFFTRVFSGGYNAVPKFIKQLDESLAAEGKKAEDYYIHYAYCPNCAKKYGDNYMIIFAKI
jgi:hypothetical protein